MFPKRTGFLKFGIFKPVIFNNFFPINFNIIRKNEYKLGNVAGHFFNIIHCDHLLFLLLIASFKAGSMFCRN